MSEKVSVNDAQSAIRAAMIYFEDFFENSEIQHVLLEGVQYVEEDAEWQVVIGFDIGRFKRGGLQVAGLTGSREPIREKRIFLISEQDGSLKKMS